MTDAAVIGITRDCVLLVAVGVAVYTDLTGGKVPNWCTFPAIALGLLLNYVAGAVEPAQGNAVVEVLGRPLISSLAGLALALGIFGVAYLLKMIGGGDVKLMCAVGAIQGWRFFIHAAIITACAGAVIALGVLIWRGRLTAGLKSSVMALFAPRRFRRHRQEMPEGAAELVTIPYATAIAIGTVATLILAWTGRGVQ